MRKSANTLETSIYTVRPAVSEYQAPPGEQENVPLAAKVLEWIAGALWFLVCFVWFGWLVGWGTIEPGEMHKMVVGSLVWVGLGFVLAFVGTLVRRGR